MRGGGGEWTNEILLIFLSHLQDKYSYLSNVHIWINKSTESHEGAESSGIGLRDDSNNEVVSLLERSKINSRKNS